MIINIWTKQSFQKLDNQQDGISSSNEIINIRAAKKAMPHLKELAQIRDYQLMQQQDTQKYQGFKNYMSLRKNSRDVTNSLRQN